MRNLEHEYQLLKYEKNSVSKETQHLRQMVTMQNSHKHKMKVEEESTSIQFKGKITELEREIQSKNVEIANLKSRVISYLFIYVYAYVNLDKTTT